MSRSRPLRRGCSDTPSRSTGGGTDCRSVLHLVVLLVCAFVAPVTAQEEERVAGLPSSEALELGERMYREGLLPSGEPIRAFVQEDVEVFGTMFSCESCHVRSGMGSLEGTVITLPTSASWLYKPLVGAEMSPQSQARVPARLDPPPFRMAYDDRALARAIRLGRDPNGRVLDWVMPRYVLNATDMEILIHYLKNLSAEWSPGVDDTTLKFATVVSDDVEAEDRDAMVRTLEAHVRDRNSQSRHEERRARGGPFYKEEKNVPYRRYSLAVWELHGSPETWSAQLEDYYRSEPVFALLGGITKGSWAPIHEFSERHEIPCLLPVTDYPVISDSDWYTLYFSKGYYQEGETAARFMRRSQEIAAEVAAVQVYRTDRRGRTLARGFADARDRMGLPAAVDIGLDSETILDEAFWRELATRHAGAVLVLWLGGEDLSAIDELSAVEPRPPALFVSSSMLGDTLFSLPDPVRGFTFITHPMSFPEDEVRARLATERWLQAKGLPITSFDIQAKMYFLGSMLAGAVKMIRDDFYRDYFFDRIDMMRDQYYSIAVYPRLSFGPGQRYASKGCYVAQLTRGPDPRLEKRSNWVVH
jgi:hypothetical protein